MYALAVFRPLATSLSQASAASSALRVGALTSRSYSKKPSSVAEWTHQFAFEENFNAIDRPRAGFQVMNTAGEVLAPEYDPSDKDLSWRMYTTMLKLNALDNVMYDIQRQGKISFYMTHYGEEAALMGSASSLTPEDVVYGQYREAGVLLWRGMEVHWFAPLGALLLWVIASLVRVCSLWLRRTLWVSLLIRGFLH
jgi:2-oxoisovalerate dehydrogenase E1 component subunit alpha